MAVQRHGRFQPQTVPRPKTGIHHIVLVEIVEYLNDRFGGDAGRDDFESIFPGVARSGDKERVLAVFDQTAAVPLHFCQMRPPGRHPLHCGRTLHRNHGGAHGVS